jgi:hypothetical protein
MTADSNSKSDWNTKVAGTRTRQLHYCTFLQLLQLHYIPKTNVIWALFIRIWICWVGIMPDGAASVDKHGSYHDTCVIRSLGYLILHIFILSVRQHLLHHGRSTLQPFASPHSTIPTPTGLKVWGRRLQIPAFDVQINPHKLLLDLSWRPPRSNMIVTSESCWGSIIIMPTSVMVTSMRISGRAPRNNDRLV